MKNLINKSKPLEVKLRQLNPIGQKIKNEYAFPLHVFLPKQLDSLFSRTVSHIVYPVLWL